MKINKNLEIHQFNFLIFQVHQMWQLQYVSSVSMSKQVRINLSD